MHRFYSDQIEGQLIFLNDEEAKHCSKVLRLQMGDTVQAFDGKGNLHTALIQQISKQQVQAKIIETQFTIPSPYRIHLAIAPTKNISRLEWCIEKTCELGIASITPLLCRRSERKVIKPLRLEKIILAAIKQSQKTHLPKLHKLTSVKDYLKQTFTGSQYICHCAYETNPHLASNFQPSADINIMIGPEGDFHEEEIHSALASGFHHAGLGKERLRTETAGVYAVSIFHTLHAIKK
jgi:16S rRNA (uracil1498-N3)-methyltransferase